MIESFLKIIFLAGIMFSIVFLFKSIMHFFSKQTFSATYSLLLAFLFLGLSIKVAYVYYNFFLHLLLIICCLFYLRSVVKRKSSLSQPFLRKIKFQFIPILIFSFLFLWISDLKLNTCFSGADIGWSEKIKLEWSNYKCEVNKDECFGYAITASGLSWKINKLYNYPPAIVYARMYPQESTASLTTNEKNNDTLLIHEQLHFDITEVFARKTQVMISECWGKNETYIETLIEKLILELHSYQDLYDTETNHGLNIIKQKEWENKIAKQLVDN